MIVFARLARAVVSVAERVVVIVNERAPESVVLARHYLRARNVPARNVVRVSCPPNEQIADDACDDLIVRPVKNQLAKTGLDKTADFLLTTRGVPLLTATGFSVDGRLMVMDMALAGGSSAPNPFFGQTRPFSRRAFGGLYLCTRLDGYTAQDARALLARSLAACAHRGPFLFDADPRRQRPGYGGTNDQMRLAAAWLRARGFNVRLDDTPDFARAVRPLAGYFSWGSNDGAFDPAAYAALRFLPGALAETAVSTSGRTLRATTGGQSLIADLVAQGVTGVKGYVSEPYLFAIAHPDVLFARYLSGRNLAESFYAASTVVNWKDVVLGDPLCATYAAT